MSGAADHKGPDAPIAAVSGIRGFGDAPTRLLSAALDATRDHIYIFDRAGRLVYVGAAGAAALGRDRTAMVGKTEAEMGLTSEATVQWERDREAVFATGRPARGSIQYPVADGLRDYEYTVDPLLDDQGNIEFVIARAVDVTERNRAEAMLQEKEAQLSTLAEAAPGFVWTAPGNGLIDWVNRRYWEYTGMPETNPITNISSAVIHPNDLPKSVEAWLAAQESGTPYGVELRIRGKDGVYRWFLARSAPYRNPEGEITRWFGVTTDVNDLKQARFEMETLNARLRRAMQETHHRVKNNLQIVASLLEMHDIDRGQSLPPSERIRLSQHIHALAAVHDLLTDEARQDGEAGYIQAKAILEKLLPMLQGMAEHKPIKAIIEDARFSSRQGTSLALITNELISNALKHGASEINLNFVVRDGTATMTIRDDGPGFPTDFDPRAAATTGLELVQHLAEWDLRGTVAFSNAPVGEERGGAQVVVTMPLRWEEE